MGKDLESRMCPLWLGEKALRERMGKTVGQSGRNGREQTKRSWGKGQTNEGRGWSSKGKVHEHSM